MVLLPDGSGRGLGDLLGGLASRSLSCFLWSGNFRFFLAVSLSRTVCPTWSMNPTNPLRRSSVRLRGEVQDEPRQVVGLKRGDVEAVGVSCPDPQT